MTELLLAAPGIPAEPAFVLRAPARGVEVRRRCVDTVELLAAAGADPSVPVVVSAALPRLSADAVARLRAGRCLVGLAAGPDDHERLLALGVPAVLDARMTADDLVDAVLDAIRAHAASGSSTGPSPLERPPGVWATGAEPARGALSPASARGAPSRASTPGAVLAVWGPIGSPGRTTVAIGVAEALAATGRRVCLVDADTYAPSVALALGLLEDTSGLVVACRQAEVGRLDPGSFTGAVRSVAAGWHVLTGVPSARHWADARASALERVWDTCRASYDVTVIDAGFCLEAEEDGVWARGRNAAAITAVAAADHVLAVADADARGVVRLVADWPQVVRLTAGRPVTVVRNRVEGRGSGHRGWEQVARDAGVQAPIRPVPADRRALWACWRQGRGLIESGSRSPVRRALGDLAQRAVSG